uniref:AIR synthase n=1 Tax=candidate division WOR-3 bacterium TaxID=2052148 RepID=A0A7C1NF89_UNCW3
MAKLPAIGKISAEVFNELIFPHLGAENPDVLVGPQHGVDVGIVRIGNKAVAITTDPVFIVPEYGWHRAAWFAIHILASDAVTSGLAPTYLVIDLNLPMMMTEDALSAVWTTIDQECRKMGIAIVSGHTARYENCNFPMVGGATVFAVGELESYVSPRFARAGDKIIITKGPAIEACGIFAAMFPKLLLREFGKEFAQKAEGLFYKMSVVEDALTAVKVGVRENGITALHDATECGVLGGVYELAQAANLGVRIDKGRIVVEDCVDKICRFFKIDPYKAISEGTLIITCREHKAEKVVEALRAKQIKSSIVGELVEPRFGMILIEDNKEKPLEHPTVDPFWQAFYEARQNYEKLEQS